MVPGKAENPEKYNELDFHNHEKWWLQNLQNYVDKIKKEAPYEEVLYDGGRSEMTVKVSSGEPGTYSDQIVPSQVVHSQELTQETMTEAIDAIKAFRDISESHCYRDGKWKKIEFENEKSEDLKHKTKSKCSVCEKELPEGEPFSIFFGDNLYPFKYPRLLLCGKCSEKWIKIQIKNTKKIIEEEAIFQQDEFIGSLQ